MNDIDREEHRLAALAAGYEISFSNDDYPRPQIKEGDDWRWLTYWHPKSSEEDSFGLMVAAGITYDAQHSWASAKLSSGEYVNIPLNDDPLKAIFKCAVAIGRSIEASNEH